MRGGLAERAGPGAPLVPAQRGNPETLGVSHAGSGGPGGRGGPSEEGARGPRPRSGTSRPGRPLSPGDGGQRGGPTRGCKRRKPVERGAAGTRRGRPPAPRRAGPRTPAPPAPSSPQSAGAGVCEAQQPPQHAPRAQGFANPHETFIALKITEHPLLPESPPGSAGLTRGSGASQRAGSAGSQCRRAAPQGRDHPACAGGLCPPSPRFSHGAGCWGPSEPLQHQRCSARAERALQAGGGRGEGAWHSPSPRGPPEPSGLRTPGVLRRPRATLLRQGRGSGAWGSGQGGTAHPERGQTGERAAVAVLLSPPRTRRGGRAAQDPPSSLTSVRFAGVDSLEVFIFFGGWEVFDGVKGVFGFEVICREEGRGGQGGGLRAKPQGLALRRSPPAPAPPRAASADPGPGPRSPRNALTVEMESRCPFRTGGGGGGGPAGVLVGGGGGFPRLGGSAEPCSL